jgi:hypothetical protein
VESLREERDDAELVHLVLEVLTNSITAGSEQRPAGDEGPSEDGAGPGAANAEAFARVPAHVELILSLLDESDFYVRYHTVQLLTALSATNAHHLREAIMSNPMGVGRLMDMMLEREVIRNETLLLLISLTRGSEDLRKLVAFEGAFERCFNIIREEGAADGGIIVQDCLELCNNLLRGSPSNQTFFRESSFLNKLPDVVSAKVPAPSTGGPPLAAQKAANLLCALELVTLLVSDGEVRGAVKPSGANAAGDDAVAAELAARDAAAKATCRVANQAALVRVGMMDALLALCLGQRAPNSVPVRVFALRCLGDLVADSRENQDALFGAEVAVAGRRRDAAGIAAADAAEPALLATHRVALRGADRAERHAAEGVFARCLRGNHELQLMLISTIAPAGDDEDDDSELSLGGLLARALVGKTSKAPDAPRGGPTELEVSCHAAAVLRHALEGNAAAKARILSIPLELPSSSAAPPELLLPRIVRYLAAAARAAEGDAPIEGFSVKSQAERIAEAAAARRDAERTQAVLLRLLISWLHGCAPAVNAFLAPAAHLPMLADLARAHGAGAGSAHVAGLASVLLGCCLANEEGSSAGHVDARAVLDVVTSRVGLNEFFTRWEEMRRTPEFLAAAAAPALAKPLTRVTAQRLAASGAGPEGIGSNAAGGDAYYDHAMAAFIASFEETVKERVIALYARPKPVASSNVSAWEQNPGETVAAHAARLKSLLRSQDAELAEQRARNAVLAEQLMASTAGGGGPGGGGGGGASIASTAAADASSAGESAELKGALDRARRAAEEELSAVKAELEESRAAAAASEENLRSLSEAYNGLEAEVFRHEEEARGLRARLEASEKNAGASAPVAAPPAADALAAAKEEGRREAVDQMARRLEETEEAAAADVEAARADAAELRRQLEAAATAEALAAAREEGRRAATDEMASRIEASTAEAEAAHEAELGDLLVCLGQEENKKDALYARLVEKHGESEAELDAMLEECVADDDEEDA